MKEDALSYRSQFRSIRFGTPLLTTEEDNRAVIQAAVQEFSELQEDEVLVFMGHGTTHYANSVYAALDYMFKDLGHKNIFWELSRPIRVCSPCFEWSKNIGLKRSF